MPSRVTGREDHVTVAVVEREDEDFVYLKVPRDNATEVKIEEGMKFFTLCFFVNRGGSYFSWMPFKKKS